MLAFRLSALVLTGAFWAALSAPLGGALAAEAAPDGADLTQGQRLFTAFAAAPEKPLLSDSPTETPKLAATRDFAVPGLPKKPEQPAPAPAEQKPAEPQWIELDTSGNGKNDTLAIDLNSDGLFDIMRVDENEDGQIDYVLFDNDFNGVIDLVVTFTTDANGQPISIWTIDPNEDGKPDVYGIDSDLDGNVDRFISA